MLILYFIFEPHNANKEELLIIEDNSPDGTAEIVKRLQKEFPEKLHIHERKGKLGLGTAYIAGFKWKVKWVYGSRCQNALDQNLRRN